MQHPFYVLVRFIILASPRSVMDNTEDSGSSAGGSIPSEGTILLFQLYIFILQHCFKEFSSAKNQWEAYKDKLFITVPIQFILVCLFLNTYYIFLYLNRLRIHKVFLMRHHNDVTTALRLIFQA